MLTPNFDRDGTKFDDVKDRMFCLILLFHCIGLVS